MEEPSSEIIPAHDEPKVVESENVSAYVSDAAEI